MFFGYAIPIILACVGGVYDIFGQNGYWCWIDKAYKDNLMIIQLVILWVLAFLGIIFNIMARRNITNELDEEEINNRKEYLSKLVRYPVITIVTIFFISVNRLNELSSDENIILQSIQMFFVLLQGFFYAVFSVGTFGIKNIKDMIQSILCCCCKKNKVDYVPGEMAEFLNIEKHRFSVDSNFSNSSSVFTKN